MEKQGVVNLNVNAVQSSKVATKIQFSSLDTNSAKLIFNVTKDGAPLPLSAARAILDLRMADWSTFSNLPVKIKDAAKGVMEYSLTNEQLKHTGMAQAELSVVYENGQSMSISKFEFKIDKALRDQDVVVKAEHYIKDIEDIKNHIQTIADDVEGLDVVQITSRLDEMEQALEDGTVGVDEQARQEIQEVSARLAENTSKLHDNTRSKNYKIQPMMTFVTDDARIEDYTVLKDIFKRQGIGCTTGVITNSVGATRDFCSLEQLKELQNQHGWEIISHTHTHPRLNEKTESEVDDELRRSHEWLKTNGFNGYNILCYPYNAWSLKEKKIAAKYYDCARTSNYGITSGYNSAPLSSYELKSIFITTDATVDPVTGYARNSLNHYKAMIDKALTRNEWFILSTHSWEISEWGYQQLLEDIIIYAKTKMPIVSMNEAMKRIKNTFDAGDYAISFGGKFENHFVVGANGTVSSNSVNTLLLKPDEVNGNTSINEFKDNTLTICSVSANKPGFPTGNWASTRAGNLYTHKFSRIANEYDFYYQTFRISGTSDEYIRKCNTDGTWDVWKKILKEGDITIQNPSPSVVEIAPNLNAYNGVTPITDFPLNKVTYTKINTSGADEFLPVKFAGVLITHRIDSNVNYCFQQFKRYGSTDTWVRTANDNGWSAWQKYTVV